MSDEYTWSTFGLINALAARVSGRAPVGVSGVSIDTRTIEKGDLFIALKGENSDGHDYVKAAFAKGAAAAVIDEAHAADLQGSGPLFVVDDVMASMESLGKTGTKEALRVALSPSGETHASAASYNNHWGVPLTLARMKKSARFGVFEIGMNHAGEITPLVAMVRPHAAIVTAIAPVHLEHFASIDAIAEAKAEIFSGLEAGGAAIINRDIAQYELLRMRASASRAGQVLSFGTSGGADARLLVCETGPEGSEVKARVLGQDIAYRLAAPGKHLAMNSLAVLLAAHCVGVPAEDAARALAAFEAPVGRGQRVTLFMPKGEAVLIDESYNANPTSMRAALALLGQTKPQFLGRRIAVLGDMLELGPDSEKLHVGLAEPIVENSVDAVYASGPMMKRLFDALPSAARGAWAEKSADLEPMLMDAVAAGDVIMVKGSNGSRMGPIVASLKQKFARRDGAAQR
jgi:UDP-N-acetylmuramoyl-tripeptide--D-alanyl-D-alanine ligase